MKKKSYGKWLIAFTVILPTFIEIMDTSVVNVSLPHIQGSLSAGVDEVTWVLTSYLVSNAVIIPITGWLSSIFGRKRYLLFSIFLFTLSSIMCGSATSLAMLVIARIFQGIGGGGLQPLSQAILLENFPKEEHGMAMAVFGVGVVFAPILGPVLGGWITDNWTWRWVFYINVPIGILSIVMTYFIIFDPPYIKKILKKIDYWGLTFLALGLGTLQVVLDKGEREDWFNSDFIVILLTISVISLILFVFIELHTDTPVVDLRVFKDGTFTMGNIIMFFVFFTLFGSIVMLPLYLQKLMGYTAFWAGLVLGPGGIASMLIMPIAGVLMKRGVKPNRILAFGIIVTAYSIYLMSQFNLYADFFAIAIPRIIMGFGLGLFFVPLAAATYVNIPKEKMGNATSVFNLLRNLGGSFGVAFSTTILAQRMQYHQSVLVEHINPFSKTFQYYFPKLKYLFSDFNITFYETSKTLKLFYLEVQRQSAMLAYNDVFWIMSVLTILMLPLTFFMKVKNGDGEKNIYIH